MNKHSKLGKEQQAELDRRSLEVIASSKTMEEAVAKAKAAGLDRSDYRPSPAVYAAYCKLA